MLWDSNVDSQSASSMPDDTILQQVLDLAIEASQKAGEIIRQNSGGADVVETKSTSRDLLTLVDPLCEKVGTINVPR